jgi:hypothetical protein
MRDPCAHAARPKKLLKIRAERSKAALFCSNAAGTGCYFPQLLAHATLARLLKVCWAEGPLKREKD